MSDSSPQALARAYRHPSEIPNKVSLVLSRNEAAANVILPFMNKAMSSPRGDDGNQNLWIVVYDDDDDNGNNDNVVLVLSCTTGPMGDYPIFIVTCKPFLPAQHQQQPGGHAHGGQGTGHTITDLLTPLLRCLLEDAQIPPQRVFSVFASAPVATAFATLFETHSCAREHGVRAIKEYYYDATLMCCTRETFVEPLDLKLTFAPASRVGESAAPRVAEERGTEDDCAIGLCLADDTHLEGVARLCKAFSKTSPPYELNDADAKSEAETMITNQQAWVHMMQSNDDDNTQEGSPEIACLVATTRASAGVTAITKVITEKRWRNRGCALRLLHRVCHEIFRDREKMFIVLYLGNSAKLAPALRVYQKIGFYNLAVNVEVDDADISVGEQSEAAVGVERWLEIGFEPTRLGYW